MRISFIIFITFITGTCFAKETFLNCSIQGTETFLTNTISTKIIPPTNSSVKIVDENGILGIFVTGPADDSSLVLTNKLNPNDSFENLSTNTEYNVIYISEKLATVIKIDRASGLIKIEKDFKANPQMFSRTRLYGTCNKIDNLKF